jgi:hypothetical protein
MMEKRYDTNVRRIVSVMESRAAVCVVSTKKAPKLRPVTMKSGSHTFQTQNDSLRRTCI